MTKQATLAGLGGLLVLALTGACAREATREEAAGAVERAPTGTVITVRDTVVASTLDAAGVAEPVAQATLSTKLMGTVTEVLVKEGDRVRAGQTLLRIDARDLAAKGAQVQASIAEAEAMRRDAETNAGRMRALYADSAAPKAQLDAAETGLLRAEAAVRAARAGAAELGAVAAYSVVRAPFDGVVTRRFVDPGAFAAPGAPLVSVQDDSRLRVSVSAAPEAVRALRRGDPVTARIEDAPAAGTVEGVVPAASGQLYTVNAIVDNRGGRFLAGSAATLALAQGERHAILVPVRAVVREGDLAGVYLQTDGGGERRWVRLGRTTDDTAEVVAGLRAGERIIVPAASAGGE